MQLSVVIVNYNVKHFLEQCLQSVMRASANISCEVFVVDNNSQDGSQQMVQSKFPEVKLIANAGNPGFSRANNQAMALASGEFVLILNPDTVVGESTFQTCMQFMQTHSQAGALGVKMVDGKGIFLPESKRGLPTPAVAFYKMFGLASLFPKSLTFGKYHLGFLSKEENHEVEILSGAFMFFRKTVLDQIGYFDETFFMYGEDIDLSYRVLKAGYKNYYLADTAIIHYKGESTKKGSLNYVKVFYEAMIIFAKKHFAAGGAAAFSFLIHVAVVFRAVLTLLSSLLASSFLPLIDMLLAYGGLYAVIRYWAANVKNAPEYYPLQFLGIVVPAYVLIWMIFGFFSGAYEKPFRSRPVIRGILAGTVVIAALYAFLPESWRFSRAIILLGTGTTAAAMFLTRLVYNLIRHSQFTPERTGDYRVLVVGSKAEQVRTQAILQKIHSQGTVVAALEQPETAAVLNYIRAFDIAEVIFCSQQFSFSNIISFTERIGQLTNIKILNPGSEALIGSNSKNTAGDLYADDVNLNLMKPMARSKKRMLDLVVCALLWPVLLPLAVFAGEWKGFLKNLVQVFSGKKTWVGYWLTDANAVKGLPALHPGVLHSGSMVNNAMESEAVYQLNLLYAKHYTVTNDLLLIWKGRRAIGK
ncbi:MAG: glycosyltransferase family 2 protein [Chitinophagales bacterium]